MYTTEIELIKLYDFHRIASTSFNRYYMHEYMQNVHTYTQNEGENKYGSIDHNLTKKVSQIPNQSRLLYSTSSE